MRAVKGMIPVYLFSLALVTALALLASRSVTLLTEVTAIPEPALLPTVIVDPGHGGEDGGAVAPDGTPESALNLETSLRLRDLLVFLGLPTVMTRESDVSIHGPEAETVSEKKVSDLKNRVKLAGETPKALLISVHQNMYTDPKYRGAQCFYAAEGESRILAESLQRVLDGELDPANHRKAKLLKTSYLLNHVSCTGVLVECGFLSNPEEAALLKTAVYQKKLAAAVCAGLTRYLQSLNEA